LGRADELRTVVDVPAWYGTFDEQPEPIVPISRFERLFDQTRVDSESPAVAEPEATEEGGARARLAFCDVCRQPRRALVGADGAFMTLSVMGDSTGKTIAAIGSCPACELDQCGGCATWIAQPSAPGDFGLRRAACRHCGALLHSKTAVDFDRFRAFFRPPDDDASEGEPTPEDVKAGLVAVDRVLRVLYEEEPVFLARSTKLAYDETVTSLLGMRAELEQLIPPA
jgi:hypothetical protein